MVEKNYLIVLLIASLRLHFFAVQDFFWKLPNPPRPLLENGPSLTRNFLPYHHSFIYYLHYKLHFIPKVNYVSGWNSRRSPYDFIFVMNLTIGSFQFLRRLCNAVPSTAHWASPCKPVLKDLLAVLEIPPSLLMHRLLSSTA